MTKESEKTTVKDVSVKHEGAQITLPIIKGKPMSYKEAIEWLKRKESEDEQEVGVHYEFKCSPLDGAIAFHRAIAQIYGWSQGVTVPGGFFRPEQPPMTVGVAISATEKMEVLWGRIEVPGIEGFLQTHLAPDTFMIGGKVKKKHSGAVKEISDLTQKLLQEKSIYRHKAIKVSFAWKRDPDEDRSYDPLNDCPQFMNLSGVKEDDLIFGEKVINDLNVGLFLPVEYPEACRDNGVPLKRGVLLYGPYGTGKTMTAHVTALKAIKNGWTFIYLDSVLDLKEGLQFAAKYAPAVIFAEDIDRVITGERSLGMDDVLNTLDGVDTKGAEIITVFTTNHIERINPAILRMGRLDTLVEVLPPDAKAAERLVTLYARGLLSEDANLTKVGKALVGKIPAFIREVTERAKIAAIGRKKGGSIVGQVMEADLLAAALAMEPHAAMLEPKEEKVVGNPTLSYAVPVNSAEGRKLLKGVTLNGGTDVKTA